MDNTGLFSLHIERPSYLVFKTEYQKYCRMLNGEHSSILCPSFKLPIVIKIYSQTHPRHPEKQAQETESVSKKEGKDQESIQSSTTPDPATARIHRSKERNASEICLKRPLKARPKHVYYSRPTLA